MVTSSCGERLLSRAEAAAFLGLRPQTLAVWQTTGRYALPCIKAGSRARYRRADLERFIAQRTVGATGGDQE